MSVAQVKKRFSEFESYLRNDKEGQRRLKLLKDDVNVLRTSLATAEEHVAIADATKFAARDRADAAEAEVAALKLEVERLTNHNKSLQHETASLSQQLHDSLDKTRIPFATSSLIKDLSPERIHRWAYKTLREQRGTLKKLTRSSVRHPYGFNLEDVLSGFDEYGFATLGRTIVLNLFLRPAITVFWGDDGTGVDPEKILKTIWAQEGSEKAKFTMQQLFFHQFDKRSDGEILKDATSGKARIPDYSGVDSFEVLFGKD